MCRLLFCCCFNHEKGVMDVGIFGVLTGLINFGYQIYSFDVFGTFASMVHMAVYILLLIGVMYRNSNFLIPCIIVQPIELILGSGAATYHLFTDIESVLHRILGISLGFTAAEVMIYLWIAVIFLYREYKEVSVVFLPIDNTGLNEKYLDSSIL
nr:uncharacterized protein LOC121118777 [Lepeophtheirus salmonis]